MAIRPIIVGGNCERIACKDISLKYEKYKLPQDDIASSELGLHFNMLLSSELENKTCKGACVKRLSRKIFSNLRTSLTILY